MSRKLKKDPRDMTSDQRREHFENLDRQRKKKLFDYSLHPIDEWPPDFMDELIKEKE